MSQTALGTTDVVVAQGVDAQQVDVGTHGGGSGQLSPETLVCASQMIELREGEKVYSACITNVRRVQFTWAPRFDGQVAVESSSDQSRQSSLGTLVAAW